MVFHKRKKNIEDNSRKIQHFRWCWAGSGGWGVEEGKGWREREVFDPKFLFGLFFIRVSLKYNLSLAYKCLS